MNGEEDQMLSFAEVARRLGVCGHMVTDMVEAGELKAFEPSPGKRKRIWASELSRYRQSKRELCDLHEIAGASLEEP